MKKIVTTILLALLSPVAAEEPNIFPALIPMEKPGDLKLSAAVNTRVSKPAIAELSMAHLRALTP